MKSIKMYSILLLLVANIGAYAQFGKNKVQYQEFDWKYIQSPNFDVYYDAGTKYLAEFTAFSAEKALRSIQGCGWLSPLYVYSPESNLSVLRIPH